MSVRVLGELAIERRLFTKLHMKYWPLAPVEYETIAIKTIAICL